MAQNHLLLALAGTAVLVLVMCAAWLVQRRTRNAGIVDLAWTLGLLGLASTYALGSEGWAPRRILVWGLVTAWATRLAAHLARRLTREREDGRYADLRQRWGASFDRAALALFVAQGALAGVLSLAFLVPMSAVEDGFGLRDGAAVAIWLVAWVGEWSADRQLRAWRMDARNAGRTCRTALWRWSRHPNYFFEWIQWFAYPVLAIGLPWGWIAWSAPLLMLVLILGVSGIPPTERQALRSRGEDYREYQRTTSAFLPLPPRERRGPRSGITRVSVCA